MNETIHRVRELVPWPLPLVAVPIVAFLIGGLAAAIPIAAVIALIRSVIR